MPKKWSQGRSMPSNLCNFCRRRQQCRMRWRHRCKTGCCPNCLAAGPVLARPVSAPPVAAPLQDRFYPRGLQAPLRRAGSRACKGDVSKGSGRNGVSQSLTQTENHFIGGLWNAIGHPLEAQYSNCVHDAVRIKHGPAPSKDGCLSQYGL